MEITHHGQVGQTAVPRVDQASSLDIARVPTQRLHLAAKTAAQLVSQIKKSRAKFKNAQVRKFLLFLLSRLLVV